VAAGERAATREADGAGDADARVHGAADDAAAPCQGQRHCRGRGRPARRGEVHGQRGATHRRQREGSRLGRPAPAFGLVARVATEPKGFHLGKSFQGAAQKKGRLELAFNDLAGTFGDNKGEYVADVQVVREVV
jgi:hypothetical protein